MKTDSIQRQMLRHSKFLSTRQVGNYEQQFKHPLRYKFVRWFGKLIGIKGYIFFGY